jgi:polysaccharide pyruvyl transferase WcaK-like protein
MISFLNIFSSLLNANRLSAYLIISFFLKSISLLLNKKIKTILINYDDFFRLNSENDFDLIENSNAFFFIEINIVNNIADKKIQNIISEIEKSNRFKNRIFISIIIDSKNYVYVDEIFSSIPLKYHKLIFFNYDDNLISNSKAKNFDNLSFHILIFFEKLINDSSLSLAQRFYYKNLSRFFEHLISRNNKLLQNSENKIFNKKNYKDKDDYLLVNIKSDISVPESARQLDLLIPNYKDIFKIFLKAINSSIYSNKNVNLDNLSNVDESIKKIKTSISPKSWKKVLITGWYGTETIGDKAILGEVLYFIKACSPDCKIAITSINDMVIKQTIKELDLLEGAEILSIDKAHDKKIIKGMDAIIIGGGPLMESSRMNNLLKIFIEGFRQQKPNIIFGCGIGPLNTDEIKRITKHILMLTSSGFVRDRESLALASELFPNHNLEVACDPAFAYVRRWRNSNIDNNELQKDKFNAVGLLLRSNTKEFRKDLSKKNLELKNHLFTKKISEIIGHNKMPPFATVKLLYMNAPFIGGDDRGFNRKLYKNIKNIDKVEFLREYVSLNEQINNISKLRCSIAMRYHGHIFCIALGIPFVSINYTSKKGKISSLLKRISYSQYSIIWEDLSVKKDIRKFDKIDTNKEDITKHLLAESDRLVMKLYDTYKKLFNVNLNSY